MPRFMLYNDTAEEATRYVCGMELYDNIQEASTFLRSKGFGGADTGIILGTGLGKIVDELGNKTEVSYDEIPHFPLATVEFHQGKLIQGTLNGVTVICMQGRFHYYEGYDMEQVSFPIRVMKALGVQQLLLSGAAGAMNLDWKKGDLMMITDHINLQPSNPLIGPNDARLGTRFPDMSEAYANRIQGLIRKAAITSAVNVQEGVYVSVPGPMLESPAEYRFLHRIGADAVGMSTVPEVIVARHAQMQVGAVIVLTDECDPDNLQPIDIPELLRVAGEAEGRLINLIKTLIPKL